MSLNKENHESSIYNCGATGVDDLGDGTEQLRSRVPSTDEFARARSGQETDRGKGILSQVFDLQRSRSTNRQKRVAQYAWLIMASFIGAFIWLYADTVTKTSLSSRIAGLQTLATEEGKQMVLSVTLSDGNNVKYLIKLPQADKLQVTKEATPNVKVSSWEIEKLGTAVSTGDNPLPLGIDLKMSQVAIEPR